MLFIRSLTTARRRISPMALCLALLIMTLPACATARAAAQASPAITPEPSPAPNPVLIGDSLADGLATHGFVPGLTLVTRIGLSPRTALNQNAFTRNGEDASITEKLAPMRPTALYLWLGTNGLDSQDADTVIGQYDRLLTRLRDAFPELPICVMEVTPTRPLTGEKYQNFTPERIAAFNGALPALAAGHGATVLATHDALLGEDGFLREDWAASDGIHLLRPAHEVIAALLLDHSAAAPGQ